MPYRNTQNTGWGLRFRHLVDKHPNISFTLTIHPFTAIFLLDKNSTAATEMTIAVEGEESIKDIVRLINRKNSGADITIDRINKIVNHILSK